MGVVVQRSRILRTRAKFDAWGVTFTIEVDPELCDKEQLPNWIDIAGRRIGLGDWRPEKSGHTGASNEEEIKNSNNHGHLAGRGVPAGRGRADRGLEDVVKDGLGRAEAFPAGRAEVRLVDRYGQARCQ